MKIHNEEEFDAKMNALLEEGRITKEEYKALTDYVSKIFDKLTVIRELEYDDF